MTYTRIVNVFIGDREDGGARVWSDDLPGLILSGKDRAAVIRDIDIAVHALLEHRGEPTEGLRIDATFVRGVGESADKENAK